MARRWTRASSEYIEISIGALGFTGDITWVGILNFAGNDAVSQTLFAGGSATTGNARWLISRDTANKLNFQQAGSAVTSTTLITVSSGWVLVAVTKTSGTNTPVFHIYNYTSNSWTHENASGTLANNTAPATASRIGRNWAGGGANYFDGTCAIQGVWNAVLTNAQIEALAYTFQSWFVVQPKGLWLLDQGATGTKVSDVTGGGANESAISGTSVATSSVPVFSYGAMLPRVNAAPSVAAATSDILFSRERRLVSRRAILYR